MPAPARHLQPHAEVAERVIAPGDPGRALRIAQWVLDQPRMLNHHRGLWGYTGTAADGAPLTVQSTGIGGPSAAIVVEELAGLGARRLVRVGTGSGLAPGARLGEILVAGEVTGEDGTSRALGAPASQETDAGLTDALLAGADTARRVRVASTDLYYEPDAGAADRRRDAGAWAVDLESAAVLAAAGRRGLAAACVLAVTELAGRPAERIAADALLAVEEAMGRMAAAALA